jgi:hypothetical protein
MTLLAVSALGVEIEKVDEALRIVRSPFSLVVFVGK